MHNNKEQQGCDVICRNHSARTERDLYRVCPSKLSKHELENLYFALLEDNLSLKKTIHTQLEKIKVLSTKVQRMTVLQRNAAGKEKNCCSSKALVNEQKDIILELKKQNECMADKIRLLNMRLCSAKQFLKRTPSQNSKSVRCSNGLVSFKNYSTSALNGKQSNASVKMSCQNICKQSQTSTKETQTIATETDLPEKDSSERQCNENKCRTLMEEMKRKIINLQEELTKSHEEYSLRICTLESTVSGLNEENVRVRSNHVAGEHALAQRDATLDQLRARLRDSDGNINDLTMQLTIERRKVAELETSLKLAKMSSPAVETIERLSALNLEKPEVQTVTRTVSICSYCNSQQNTSSLRGDQTSSPKAPNDDTKVFKSDDSGYTDLNKSSEIEEEKIMEKLNQELLKRITDLQTQLDGLRIKAAGESPSNTIKMSKYFEENDSERLTNSDERAFNHSIDTTIIKDRHIIPIEYNGMSDELTKPLEDKPENTSTPNKLNEFEADNKIDGHEVTLRNFQRDFAVGENKDNTKSVNNTTLKSNPNSEMKNPAVDQISNSNKYQIPGPVPTSSFSPDNYSNKDKKKGFKNSKKGSKDNKNSSTEENNATNIEPTERFAYDNSAASTTTNTSSLAAINNDLIDDFNDSLREHKKRDSKVKIKFFDQENAVTDTITYNNVNNIAKIDVDINSSTPVAKVSKRKESILLSGKKYSKDISVEIINDGETAQKIGSEEIRLYSDPNLDYGFNKRSSEIQMTESQGNANNIKEAAVVKPENTQLASNRRSGEYEACASHVVICRCPKAKRRDVSVFRTCSGTLRFHTIATSVPLRHCACWSNNRSRSDEPQMQVLKASVEHNDRDSATYTTALPKYIRRKSSMGATYTSQGAGPYYAAESSETRRDSAKEPHQLRRDSAIESQQSRRDHATEPLQAKRDSATEPHQSRRNSATYTATESESGRRDSCTYTKPQMVQDHKCMRISSPDNTEHEISSFSDLPPEKDGMSPYNTLSPGEERAAATQTDTETGHTTDYGSLSEGELPMSTKPRKLSLGEKSIYSNPMNQVSSTQMEATLQAISEELARCKQLLASSRTHECQIREPPEKLHKLRHAAAHRRLPDTQKRTCVFTLHIGTLVLSDEAVLNSHDKSLVLMWKFYDQNVTMARMRAGRVVLFDFSTEYDVTFSEHFLNYMKQEEMLLSICEINKQDEPFATCSLPLREALLHVNTRADMSLALVEGPGMAQRDEQDPLASSDELGVLDLWCVLRVDAPLKPAINRHIYQNGPSHIGRQSVDDEYSIIRMYQEIKRPGSRLSDNRAQLDAKMCNILPYENSPGLKWRVDHGTSSPNEIVENGPASQYPDIGRYYRRRSSIQKTFPPTVYNAQNRSSECIANEVPVNITSSDEMKKALERNVHSYPATKFPRIDDEITRTHSSLCSLTTLAKKQMQKIKAAKTATQQIPPQISKCENSDGQNDFMKREAEVTCDDSTKFYPQHKSHGLLCDDSKYDGTDPAVTKKYNNTGPHKIMDSSKKTVSYNVEPKYTQQLSQLSMDQDQSIDITVLWLALNEECEAMVNPNIHKLYVAYSFLGRRGADLETPVSLPKPKHYADKCYFNFKKTFYLHEADLPLLGHLSRCRASRSAPDPRDCVVFSVVSEPPEDPLGLSSCEDIGHAHLYLGDILAYSAGGAAYTEVVPVRAAGARAVCGVLAVRLHGLHVLRRCLTLTHEHSRTNLHDSSR